MEDYNIKTIEWSLPEYSHKERKIDWFWTIGLITLVVALIALWFHNYIFAVFVLISGFCLIMFTIRQPHDITFMINSEGINMGKEKYTWKDIKGFDIKQGVPYNKLLLLTSKKFLPIYTIPFPSNLTQQLRESLLKVTERNDLEESKSMVFMEKLGF